MANKLDRPPCGSTCWPTPTTVVEAPHTLERLEHLVNGREMLHTAALDTGNAYYSRSTASLVDVRERERETSFLESETAAHQMDNSRVIIALWCAKLYEGSYCEQRPADNARRLGCIVEINICLHATYSDHSRPLIGQTLLF